MKNNKCEFLFKLYICNKKIKLTNDTLASIGITFKKHNPIIATVICAAITATAGKEEKRLNQMLINGPICGARLIEDGKVSDIIL